MNKRSQWALLAGVVTYLGVGSAAGDIPPTRPPARRASAAGTTARANAAVARELARVRTQTCGALACQETVVEAPLQGQCGYVGCSSSTLVAFTFVRTGANPSTGSVLVQVDCAPPGEACVARLADLRPR